MLHQIDYQKPRLSQIKKTLVLALLQLVFSIHPFSPGPVLTNQEEVLVEAFVLPIDNAKQFQRQVRLAEYALHHLRANCYEIWSAGHNVNDYNNGGFHIADAPTGPVTTILNRLNTLLVADGRRIAPPPLTMTRFLRRNIP